MKILKTWKKAATVLFSLFMLSSCAFWAHGIEVEIIGHEPLPQVSAGTLLAGAAKEDITPPPGMPLAGYALWANKGRGFRNRLYTRVVYLKSASGTSVALVQCDLLSGSLLLNQRVAELIASQTDIGMENLLIAGTHTHSGPGNYFDNNFYNDHASNVSGFHPEYFEFLAQKIARAVIRAYQEKRPAKIASGKTQIWHLTRNRSLAAYLSNQNIALEKQPDIYKAVNPDLYLIRIDTRDHDGRYRPLAAISSFSIHGTAVPMKNNLYNGDVFAYIEREVERGIKKTSWQPIHAAFNGTHADNSPNYQKQGYPEARRIGTAIGRRAFELFCSLDGALKNDAVIRHAAREIDLFTEPCVENICLCDRPVVGSALAAGADDGPSPVISKLPWLKQGSARWFFTQSCQEHKRTLAGPLQYLFLPKQDFPHLLFLQVIQIDDVLLIPVPFETTKEAGARMAAECAHKPARADFHHTVVISCANGYFGYVTTPEEYRIQRYEGGHTLYGPATQPFLARHLGLLTEKMIQGQNEFSFAGHRQYHLRAMNLSKEKAPPSAQRKAMGQPGFVPSRDGDESYWSFSWEDLPAHRLSWDQPMVRVEKSQDGVVWEPLILDGNNVDDTGYDLAVMNRSVLQGGTKGLYETRWYQPPTTPSEEAGKIIYRFAVLPQSGQAILYSPAFPAAEE
jgi:neutral ceramidase